MWVFKSFTSTTLYTSSNVSPTDGIVWTWQPKSTISLCQVFSFTELQHPRGESERPFRFWLGLSLKASALSIALVPHWCKTQSYTIRSATVLEPDKTSLFIL